MLIVWHMLALVLGFVLDLLFGDPAWLPHPIRWIGRMIQGLEQAWNRETTPKQLFRRGCALVVVCLLVVGSLTAAILWIAYGLHPYLGIGVEAVMTYYILALKCLKTESMKVYHALKAKNIEGARAAVSMIVGRDTACLDATGIAKAAIETVAENTSDGVIAPLLYTALGGPVLGFLYKTVNTLDSMVGYKNPRFLYFGRCAAKLDDVVNFLPSRISAALMLVTCYFLPKEKIMDGSHGAEQTVILFDGKRAKAIYRRDRRKHASPNAAQTESVCASALGIQLAGNASYFGKVVEKPRIGDDLRPVDVEDIARANRLLYGTAFLCILAATAILGVISLWFL
jgi:adenosylcobinamide-phosphate synthase